MKSFNKNQQQKIVEVKWSPQQVSVLTGKLLWMILGAVHLYRQPYPQLLKKMQAQIQTET